MLLLLTTLSGSLKYQDRDGLKMWYCKLTFFGLVCLVLHNIYLNRYIYSCSRTQNVDKCWMLGLDRDQTEVYYWV